MLFSLVCAFLLGFVAGIHLERRRARAPAGRMRRRHFVAPARQPKLITPEAEAMRRAQWDTALINFALKASLCKSLSERAVVKVGIVSGYADYRAYQRILKGIHVWVVPRASSRVCWASGWSPARLRAALRCEIKVPDYPAGDPPPIY